MPFETGTGRARRIAVIGGGISGMGAAHRLAAHHHVTLFEAEPRLGGHARTVLAGMRGDQPVDTGFIVFNRSNYPNLVSLFETLDVPVAESNMSFGASFDGGRLEYSFNSLRALFAQPWRAADPRFVGMVRDILKFNARALDAADDASMTIGALIDKLGLGTWFRDYYLTPFSGAIWSTPKAEILDFPAKALVEFFRNHCLLGVNGQHQWYTVEGGSQQYVGRLERAMRQQGVDLRLGAPVAAVRRNMMGVEVRAEGGGWEQFEEVVFASHTDQALAILSDATGVERSGLGAIKYQPNEAVLHADTSLMPKRRACWASWVYSEARGPQPDRIPVTYWMNSLQPIPQDDPMFVTLNPTRPIRDDLIYDTTTFQHPVYTLEALEGQQLMRSINGMNHTWFCGAWMRNGFHEDGLATGLEVAEAIIAQGDMVVPLAAE